ncbi:MAG: hypothetical protein P4L31_00410, partial [Candidatus Babeliales bacterium]|nr:hypothetical protein [Candidatus Babeliales bacterium]
PGDFIDHLAPHMYQGILDDFNMQDLVLELKKKEMNNQPISFVNVYGILLAQKILKGLGADHPSAIELTCCTAIFDEVKMPLSIKTSVIGNNDLNEWTEFTPYQVGSTYLQTFIPTWAFGRKFENGFSVDFAPPQSIGFCLGIWSSAMCIDPKDFIKFVVKPNLDEAEASFVDNAIAPIATMVYNTLSKLGISYLKKDNADNPLAALSAHRIYPAEIFNWNLGIKDVPLNTEKTLALVDSGHAFNFPLPALLRKERDVDIIIIIDASDTPKDEWDNAERYIKEHNLPFPSIDRTQFNKTCSVHADPAHPDAPIIIYFPLIKNSTYKDNWDPWSVSFTGTFNEKYTQEQVHLLSGLAHSNMAQGMPIIMDTIKQWIENKKNNA